MQLDGKFTSDSLCFVISKVDQSMSVDRYIRTHPNVNKDLAPIFEKQAKFHDLSNKMKIFYNEQATLKTENENRMRLYKSELKSVTAAYKRLKDSHTQQKRKRDELGQSSGMSFPLEH
jgi:hypothetical protein